MRTMPKWIAVVAYLHCCCQQAVVAEVETPAHPNASDLRSILQARIADLRPFHAEVVVVRKAGPDVERLKQMRRRYADWIDGHRPDLAQDNQEFRSDIERQSSSWSSVWRYDYRTAADGRIRAQHLPDENEKHAPKLGVLSLRIFTGEGWKSYMEAPNEATGGRKAGLTLKSTDQENLSWHEVARGRGIFLSPPLQFESLKFVVSRRAASLQMLDWSEVLNNMPADRSSTEISIPPAGQEPMPSLILESKLFRETGKGLFRVQVWFDPKHGLTPCGLIASDLQQGGKDQWKFLPSYVIDWSEPNDIGATTIYGKCRIRHFNSFATPDEATPFEEWEDVAYNTQEFDYTFSNIRIDEPVDEGLFDITPIPGTNVIDQPQGYVYIAGKAGEQLEKTALSERDRKPAEPNARTGGLDKRWLFVGINVLILAALVAYRLLAKRPKGNQP